MIKRHGTHISREYRKDPRDDRPFPVSSSLSVMGSDGARMGRMHSTSLQVQRSIAVATVSHLIPTFDLRDGFVIIYLQLNPIFLP